MCSPRSGSSGIAVVKYPSKENPNDPKVFSLGSTYAKIRYYWWTFNKGGYLQ
jgi:hypothetical protein